MKMHLKKNTIYDLGDFLLSKIINQPTQFELSPAHLKRPWSFHDTTMSSLKQNLLGSLRRKLVPFQISDDGWQMQPRLDLFYVAFRTKMKGSRKR